MISPETQFTQLMESIRKQNDLVNNVTRTLVTVEGAIAAATGVIWSAPQALVGIGLKTLAISALGVIAIVACWAFVFAAISDLNWQGRFIGYKKALEPALFAEVKLEDDGRGVVRSCTRFLVPVLRLSVFSRSLQQS